MKNTDLRRAVYAGIVIFGIVAVCARMAAVRAERARPIISFVSEWEKYGKPVTAAEIKKSDTPVYTKLTVVKSSGAPAAGFVTADIKDKLKKGQEVYMSETSAPCGKISKLGEELDIDTGMFPIEVEFDARATPAGPTIVIFARTQTLGGVLVVPNSIIEISEGNYYLWKIENGKAVRVRVKIGLRNGYGAVIEEGISSGDVIVLSGQTVLRENDTVNVLEKPITFSGDDEGKMQ